MVALVVVTGLAAFVVPAVATEPIEDRLIPSVDGFETLPETGTMGEGSGPIDVSDLAAIMGADPDDVPSDMDGYMRIFLSGAPRPDRRL